MGIRLRIEREPRRRERRAENEDLPPGTALRARSQDRLPPRSGSGSGKASGSTAQIRTRVPAALRAAGRRAGTPAPVPPPRPRSPRLPLQRPLRHPAGTLAPSARPSASRRPHTHPRRGARWEPLAEAKGTAAAPQRPGSDAGYREASQAAVRAARAPRLNPLAGCGRRTHLPTCAGLTCRRTS